MRPKHTFYRLFMQKGSSESGERSVQAPFAMMIARILLMSKLGNQQCDSLRAAAVCDDWPTGSLPIHAISNCLEMIGEIFRGVPTKPEKSER